MHIHTHTLSLVYSPHSTHTQNYPPTRQFIRGVSKVTGFIIRQTSEGCSACYVTHADPRGITNIIHIE